jgi:hypothetical protein
MSQEIENALNAMFGTTTDTINQGILNDVLTAVMGILGILLIVVALHWVRFIFEDSSMHQECEEKEGKEIKG